jgi:hypothetical protein
MNPMPPPPDLYDARRRGRREAGRVVAITLVTIVGVLAFAYLATFIIVALLLASAGSNK